MQLRCKRKIYKEKYRMFARDSQKVRNKRHFVISLIPIIMYYCISPWNMWKKTWIPFNQRCFEPTKFGWNWPSGSGEDVQKTNLAKKLMSHVSRCSMIQILHPRLLKHCRLQAIFAPLHWQLSEIYSWTGCSTTINT